MSQVTYVNCNIISGVESLKEDQSLTFDIFVTFYSGLTGFPQVRFIPYVYLLVVVLAFSFCTAFLLAQSS